MVSRVTIPAFVLLTAALSPAADPLPTPEAIQSLADAKDWAGLLQATTRTIVLKGAAAQPYDRADLWMKKAEAQLHLNQFTPASQSMARAADEKTATPEQKDKATALSVLFRKTDAKGYRSSPKIGAIKTYNVLVPAGRADALASLFEAGYQEVSGEIDRAKAATEPKALVALAKSVGELRALDRVVNKTNEKADALEKTLGGHFVDAAKKWAKPVDKRLGELTKLGDERVEVRGTDGLGRMFVSSHRRGNTVQEVGEVKQVMKQAKGFADAYHALEPVLGKVGQETIKAVVEVVDPAYEKADAIAKSANRTD